MKKMLVIGFLWPYHRRAGARLGGLLKYLWEFGWEPVLLTAPLENKPSIPFKVIEVPYKYGLDSWLKLLRFNQNASASVREQAKRRIGGASGKSFRGKLLDFAFTRALEVIDYPDLEKDWIKPALEICEQLWPKENFLAVISSSPPVTGHIIAKKLKIKYGVPWIADLPHLWSQNNSYAYSPPRRLVDRMLELKTLAPADYLTTTSGPLAYKLESLHRDKTVFSITHGFDPETLNSPPGKLADKFTVTYTGGFHPQFRTPVPLLAALQSLLARRAMERERVAVRFYGPEESWIENEIEQRGLSGVVRQLGRVPMPEAQARQRESQLLYNPKWDDPKEPGIHSLKLLEYLAARRPVLATGKFSDVADDLLAETGAGVYAADAAAIERSLTAAYREYMQRGAVAWHGNEAKIAGYSQREMAHKFARILDSLT
ncbi:MAG: glycosyltransferase [Dehalococcoidales bacterium]|jgi:glycosyltransferase involved in cell wall biosynthesis